MTRDALSGTLRFAFVFKAFRDVGTKVLPMAPSRISMIMLKNSPFAFGPLVRGYALPTPNDITFGLLGSQTPRMQPHLGWGPPKPPPLAPKRSKPKSRPRPFFHFWQKHGNALNFFGRRFAPAGRMVPEPGRSPNNKSGHCLTAIHHSTSQLPSQSLLQSFLL